MIEESSEPGHEWVEHMPMSEVTLVSGETVTTGPVMRREVDGEWEYRAMTADEEHDFMRRKAW